MQNGTTDQVDKIVKILNDGKIVSTDIVGTDPPALLVIISLMILLLVRVACSFMQILAKA